MIYDVSIGTNDLARSKRFITPCFRSSVSSRLSNDETGLD